MAWMKSKKQDGQTQKGLPRLADRRDCTGCSACFAACPRNAIAMKADDEGFLRPVINAAQCIRCGACSRACPVLAPGAPSLAPTCFAARSKDLDLRLASSSGGLFTELARTVLNEGGLVFGVVLEKPALTAIHVAAETEEALAAMRGSKYVQSDPRHTFRQVRDALRAGRRVLYSGTPCQIAGLHRFLGKADANLLTVELICHGVPSPAVFDAFKAELAAEHGSAPTSISARDKHYSWRRCSLVSTYADTSENREDLYTNRYIRAFLADLCLRPSCYRCRAREGRSGADITLADFWGIEKVCPALDDDRGTSAVLLHTEAGRRAWAACADGVESVPVTLEQVTAGNGAYLRPPSEPFGRKRYMAHFRDYPLAAALDLATHRTWYERLVRHGRNAARRLIASCRKRLTTTRGGVTPSQPFTAASLPAA